VSCPGIIYRVAGDIGQPITVTHRGVNVTGWTITGRFRKQNGELYEIVAAVTEVGDGADVAAEYSFQFSADDLTTGLQEFDIHYSAAGIDDYSWPARDRFKLQVRDA
jgi:hypothetical protein